MKNLSFFIISLFVVFCTERLEKVFAIGFFDLYPCRFLFIVLLISFNLSDFKKYSSKPVKSILNAYLLFILFVFISVFKSSDVLFSFKKWLDIATVNSFVFLTYSFLLRSARNTSVDTLNRIFLKYFRVIILIIAVGGLFLYRTLGTGEELETRAILGISFYRRISLFNDPNFYSSFLIVAFFITYFSKMKTRKFILGVIIVSVFLTGSKGGILSLIVTLILYFRGKIPILRSRFFIYGVIGVLLTALCIILFYPYFAIDTITNSSLFSSKSGSDTGAETVLPRILAWSGGMKAFLQEPIFGLGPGNIINIAKGQKISGLLDYVQSSGFYGLEDDKIDKLATHSVYLETLFETGIISFVFFIIFVYRIFKYLLYGSIILPRCLLGYTLAFISFYLSIFFLSYSPYFMAFLTGFYIFLVDKYTRERMEASARSLAPVSQDVYHELNNT